MSGTSRRVSAYVGLGANVGDLAGTLARAVAALEDEPGIAVRAVSPLYASAPVGLVDQPEFRNAVVRLEVPAGPDAVTGALAMLTRLKRLEREFGRRRRQRWGPRELDLDLLVFGRALVDAERTTATRSLGAETDEERAARRLVVPHREAHRRSFVLAPLADLAAGLVPPGWHETVRRARDRQAAVDGPEAVRLVGTWDPAQGRWTRPEAADATLRPSPAQRSSPER
ncbi:MAG: 2-amino-4-hydroxy-6-hydroxymethyldihydropteridine diphosphokinase [Chloroflexota bacterium]